ncbi:MAG: LysR family transcriptional regulator [Rhodospirillaceae bacterium]|nr:LysR family transcriptional regulator [Rhodospirillaceae bacterium]
MARMPSLNALRAFEASARHLSVTLAANELSVTPGAVSRLIKALEDDLGVRLIERHGRGITLTAAAQDALPRLRRGFGELQAAVGQLVQTRGERPLSISVEPVFASGWLVARLGAFHNLAPSIDLRIDATNVVPDASRSDTDVAIYYGAHSGAEQDSVKLLDEVIFPVCSPALLEHADPIDKPADLVRFTLLHYDDAPSSWLWPDWHDWFEALGVYSPAADRGPRMVAGTAIMDAARSGQGMALACTSVAADDLESGRLIRPLPEAVPASAGYLLATKAADRNRADIAAFRDWLVAAIRATKDNG